MTEFLFEQQDALTEELSRARILIVDDNEANLLLLSGILEEAGYENVLTEPSSRAAVKRWLEEDFDLLLLDIRMPEMDGHAVMAFLKGHLAADDYLPCIVLTAQTDRETRDQALDAGAVDFLTKPFDFEETLKRIRTALCTRLLHKQNRHKANEFGKTISQQTQLLKEKEQDLAYLAEHDAITGLLNRQALIKPLQAMAQQTPTGITCALIEVTDADQLLLLEGMESVDRFLREISTRLTSEISNHFGVCGVWGGQTFLCALPLIGDSALAIFERLMAGVFKPISLGSFSIAIHGRGGSAQAQPQSSNRLEWHTVELAITSAGFALANAHKRSNRIIEFDQIMADSFMRRNQIEQALLLALEQDPEQFQLHYQPKVGLTMEHAVGCEALVRWQHPEMGWISPGEFIPIAEEKGYIVELGLIVIEHAVAFIAQMQRQWGSAIPVAVNVSGHQFELMRAKGENLVDEIQKILQRHNVEPHYLEIEITESVLLSGFDWVIEKLEQLRELGVAIALDDFGTGYSSLSYLQRLPITTLKIDRSFVDNAAVQPKRCALLGSIVRMAHELGLKTVAEGVENQADLDTLKQLNCDIAQGYFFSRPIPGQNFMAWAARDSKRR